MAQPVAMSKEDREKLFVRYWKVRDRAHREKAFGTNSLTGNLVRVLDEIFYKDDLRFWHSLPLKLQQQARALASEYNAASWRDDGSEDRHWDAFAAVCGTASRTIYNRFKKEGVLPYQL